MRNCADKEPASNAQDIDSQGDSQGGVAGWRVRHHLCCSGWWAESDYGRRRTGGSEY